MIEFITLIQLSGIIVTMYCQILGTNQGSEKVRSGRPRLVDSTAGQITIYSQRAQVRHLLTKQQKHKLSLAQGGSEPHLQNFFTLCQKLRLIMFIKC